ncbi:hypothetical protein GOV13_02780 [Candidatus Pacearchaeota archaeon]|nr:hypothetical protein [Candidatus Pacearchaeota archaeon]
MPWICPKCKWTLNPNWKDVCDTCGYKRITDEEIDAERARFLEPDEWMDID